MYDVVKEGEVALYYRTFIPLLGISESESPRYYAFKPLAEVDCSGL